VVSSSELLVRCHATHTDIATHLHLACGGIVIILFLKREYPKFEILVIFILDYKGPLAGESWKRRLVV
jgi:hypothetical protein